MPTIPPYLPDPFARAAWHMRHAHQGEHTVTRTLQRTWNQGERVNASAPPGALTCTDSRGNTWERMNDGTFSALIERTAYEGVDALTFTIAAHPRASFWEALAEWIAGQGHQLAASGGRWSSTDSPGDCHTADDIAQAYLANLTPDELATIPPDVRS